MATTKKSSRIKNTLLAIIISVLLIAAWLIFGDLQSAKQWVLNFLQWTGLKSDTNTKTKSRVQNSIESQIEAYRAMNYRNMGFKSTGNLMSDLKTWVLLKEGGLTDNKNDSASSYPNPLPYTYKGKYSKGWHTNKGVTYRTYEDSAKAVGYTASPMGFYRLSDDDVFKIFKVKYADPYKENSGSDLIDYMGALWAWGSGIGGEKALMQRFEKDNGKTLNQLFKENPSQLFANLVLYRIKFYERLADQKPQNKVFLKGWINVQLNFFDAFKKYL